MFCLYGYVGALLWKNNIRMKNKSWLGFKWVNDFLSLFLTL